MLCTILKNYEDKMAKILITNQNYNCIIQISTTAENKD